MSPDVAPAPGQFAYRDDVPLVRLEVADEWVRPEQAVVRYRIETVFARSSWDWIGLYRVRRAGMVRDSGKGGSGGAAGCSGGSLASLEFAATLGGVQSRDKRHNPESSHPR